MSTLPLEEHSLYEREQLARINATPAAPESFDPIAALQRVLKLADAVQRGELGDIDAFFVARLIRVAVHDSAAVLVARGAVQ